MEICKHRGNKKDFALLGLWENLVVGRAEMDMGIGGHEGN